MSALVLAMMVDATFGDPPWLYRRMPHPVVLIGRGIDWLERRLLRPENEAAIKRLAGVLLLALVLVVSAGAALAFKLFIGIAQWGWIAEGLVMGALLAQRSLVDHVRAVAHGLRQGLTEARREVALIVGRDPDRLDAAGVGRAAVESLAENLSDGVVAPLFWGVVAGLPGMLAYKAINTLDSMVGHRNERYREFGWASARLDDLANFAPSRLTGLLLCLVGGTPRHALRIMRRDAPRHRSPNAGWPEAAMAAALGLRLAGPRIYAGQMVEDALMGDGSPEVNPETIERAIALAWRVWWLLLAAVAGAALLA